MMMDLETEALFLDRILHATHQREYDSEEEKLSSDRISYPSQKPEFSLPFEPK
jgi:hypothetical protein